MGFSKQFNSQIIGEICSLSPTETRKHEESFEETERLVVGHFRESPQLRKLPQGVAHSLLPPIRMWIRATLSTTTTIPNVLKVWGVSRLSRVLRCSLPRFSTHRSRQIRKTCLPEIARLPKETFILRGFLAHTESYFFGDSREAPGRHVRADIHCSDSDQRGNNSGT